MKKLKMPKGVKLCSAVLVCFVAVGCGVKGDPVNPNTPPELGRGKPSYRRATEPLKFPVVPPPQEKTESEDENDF